MTDTLADRVTTREVATPLVDIRGPVPAHTQDRDHARGPHRQSLESLANHPGTSEGKVNEKSSMLSSSVMAMST